MQDVTDLPFWKLMARYGGPDLYYTEYFRIREGFKLERPILKSITHNPTGKPAVAQMIGNHIPSLVAAAQELQQHPVAAIDLNLGCPAPVVYKKCAGGGLLRGTERRQPLVARQDPRERRQDRVHARVVACLVCVDAQIRQHCHFQILVDRVDGGLQDHQARGDTAHHELRRLMGGDPGGQPGRRKCIHADFGEDRLKVYIYI